MIKAIKRSKLKRARMMAATVAALAGMSGLALPHAQAQTINDGLSVHLSFDGESTANALKKSYRGTSLGVR